MELALTIPPDSTKSIPEVKITRVINATNISLVVEVDGGTIRIIGEYTLRIIPANR